jgi:alkylation response protein AidB-like acyl-CoA dehydrogenase
MNFDFSDAQKMLKTQARDFLKNACPTTVPRRILDGNEPYAAELWKGIVDLEFTGISIPEQYGGIGYGYLELCCVAEELGRAVAPVPFSSSVYLATEAILAAGSEEQKKKYLPQLAAGKLIGTFALAEGAKVPTAKNQETKLEGGKVTGEKLPVPDGDVANFAIVVASSSRGPSLAIVDLGGPGVKREAVATIDPTRSHARVRFNGAPAELLGAEGKGWELKEQVFDRAAILYAMEQLGGSDACLAMAVDYAKGRFAFGRPIGSFQAIKHKLADMYIKNELARANCYYGAWALSSGAKELPIAAAGARISATQAYHFASKENIQTHGGIGFTWEHDCHLFYRRSKLLSLVLGSLHSWKDRLITHLEKQAEGASATAAA